MTNVDAEQTFPEGEDLTLEAALLSRYRAGEDLLAEEFEALSDVLEDPTAVAALGISEHEQADIRSQARNLTEA